MPDTPEETMEHARQAIAETEAALVAAFESGVVTEQTWIRYRNTVDWVIKLLDGPDNAEELRRLVGSMKTYREMYEDYLRNLLGDAATAAVTWEQARGFHQPGTPPMPVPREMHDLRQHLLQRWEPNNYFERMLPYTPHHPADPIWERNMLREASLWWVKGDMMKFVQTAMASMPSDLKPEDMLLPNNMQTGFAVFQTPYVGIDAANAANENTKIAVNAMIWGLDEIAHQKCLSLSFYRYIEYGHGLTPEEFLLAKDNDVLKDAYGVPITRTADGRVLLNRRGGAWCYIGRTDWPMTEELGSFEIEAEDMPLTDARRQALEEDRRFFAAYAVLVNHKLQTEEIILSAPRAARRRAERVGVREPGTVRIIRLREYRETQKQEGETDEEHEKRKVEYSHRWFRKGHMAWRRCGPRWSQRKRVWVIPAICGPKDKPIVYKEDVYTWVR
jgi:hypothetical protein